MDSQNKSVIYLGEPDMGSGVQITASPYSGSLKEPATFTAIETKTGTVPTKVEALTSDNIIIGSNDIVAGDFTPAWTSGDNIKMSYFIDIGFPS